MQENVGTMDRVFRSITGPALIFAGYKSLGGSRGRPLGLIAMMLGVAVAESAITRVCPLNALFGIDTRSSEINQSRRDLITGHVPAQQASIGARVH